MKSYGDGWYCWHRNWNERIQYTRIPDELEIIYRNDDGHEAIKMVMSNDNYEVGDDEHYLDDLEDDLDFGHRVNETDSEGDEEESRRRKVMSIWIVIRCFYVVNQAKVSTAVILASVLKKRFKIKFSPYIYT